MTDDLELEEGARSAPKFHTDRAAYAEALSTWFARQRHDAESVRVSKIDIPVNTGFSNETVFFEVDWTERGASRHERFVARIEPDGGALFPEQTAAARIAVGLQYRVMKAVSEVSDVRIPPLLGYEPTPDVLGKPFFVMGFVPGVVPADTPRYSQAGFLVEEATPAQRRRMVTNGLEAMAAIHAIDCRAGKFDWLDAGSDPSSALAVQLDLYKRFTDELLGGREHPVLEASYGWLRANDPHDDRIGLSWGDARLGNVIWQDYEVGAVLDWEACAISPTEADVGWWLMFDRMSFDELEAPRMDGFPGREEMIDIYQAASGRDVRDPHYWEVFATMRFCAIFIRLGDRMVGTGMVPRELNLPVANSVTQSLATLLDIENPTPSVM
jgi:aminoglycoside phosphotransferase (APT) family kinase protein